MSMGLVLGLEGLMAVAYGRVSGSSGGWLVLVLGACCSPVFAVSVRVPKKGGVGEGWGGVLRGSPVTERRIGVGGAVRFWRGFGGGY